MKILKNFHVLAAYKAKIYSSNAHSVIKFTNIDTYYCLTVCETTEIYCNQYINRILF